MELFQMERPTFKELNNKIVHAKEIADLGLVNLLNPKSIASDANELGYRIGDDFIGSLTSVLRETTPKNYAGRRPPEQSYENTIMKNALYAFRTKSTSFKCLVYLKFTLFDDQLWVVSFHKNRNLRGS